MAHLCEVCACLSWPKLAGRLGFRVSSLSRLILFAGLSHFPCPLCKLIWWSLRYDHHWLEALSNRNIPVWLVCMGAGISTVTIVTGPALSRNEDAADIQFYLADYAHGIARLEWIAIGTLELHNIRGEPTLPGITALSVVDSNPLSDVTLDAVKEQIKICTDDHIGHRKCSEPLNYELPKRLLDLYKHDDPALIRLQEISESEPRDGLEYVALSYCWGAEKRYVTTSANLSANKMQLRLADLPKTIRDAIVLTRQLGIRYLWVDALCIIQGDDELARDDWATESKRMAIVYGNAWLTISAASATTAFEGFLNPRSAEMDPSVVRVYSTAANEVTQSAQSQDERVALAPMRTLTAEKLEPLSRRAWALQEKILSNRNLIYGTSEILYVCRSGEWRESGVSSRYSQQFRDWQITVSDYTSRLMTNAEDRLPAIQGLADYFTRTQGVEIFHGIRPQCLMRDLLWHQVEQITARVSQPATDQVASWSWAAVDGAVRFHEPSDKQTPVCELRCGSFTQHLIGTQNDPAILLGDGDVMQFPSIKCQARSTYDHHPDEFCPVAFLGNSLRTYLDNPNAHGLHMTKSSPRDLVIVQDVWFLFLYKTSGLILKPFTDAGEKRSSWRVQLRRGKTSRPPKKFQRIGMFTARHDDLKGKRQHLSNIKIY